MSEKLRVLILGYGEMGHAMEHLLHEHHQLDIWEKYPATGFTSAVFEDAAQYADIILFCLPVIPHREIASSIAPLLKHDCLCLSIAKGLDEAGQTAAQVFADIFDKHQPYALLYGPMISEEIRADRYAFAQLGCKEINSYHKARSLFERTALYIEHTSDIAGISWSVIFKNVYALIFGMADELKLGDNMRGFLAVAALRELNEIIHHMGGKTNTPYHLAGLGDLVTTATSESSHHHALGRMLASEVTSELRGEGIHTLAMVKKYHLFDTADYPLLDLIQAIVERPEAVKKRIADYLKRVYN